MNKLTSLLFAAALALLPSKSRAEPAYYNNPRQIEFGEADAVVLGVNAGIGCAFGAVPSIVKGKRISRTLENCLKGMLAGAVIYAGEKTASHSSTPGMGWAGHVLMGDGVSMRENLALGNGLFDRLAYDIGPLRLSMGTKEANSGKNIQWYLLPGSVFGIVTNIAYGNDWNEKATLYSGTIVFDFYRKGDFLWASSFFGGITNGNVITMNHAVTSKNHPLEYFTPKSQDDFTLAYEHEHVHAVQYREFGSLDLVLRFSDLYTKTMDKAHLSLGSDIVVMTLVLVNVLGGYPVADGVPNQLTTDTLYGRWVEQ